jgi:hypothetical protein
MDASGSHCSPGYSGGRDQEDGGSKPAWANSLWHPILKNPSQERADGVAQSLGPEFKPQLVFEFLVICKKGMVQFHLL